MPWRLEPPSRTRTDNSPSGSTARLLVLIGLIIQIVQIALAILVLDRLASIAAAASGSLGGALSTFFDIGVVLILLNLIFSYLVYRMSYLRIAGGNFEGATTPTLVFALLALFTFWFFSGIFYLHAWVKLRDAGEEYRFMS
jgi:hypothetical protein